MANVEIRSVYLGVTGNHIRGFNNHGVHPVPSADREITQEDVQDVMKNAKAINLPADNTVVHAIRQHFHVDGQSGILNPVGMYGARVEVDMHVVHGLVDRLKNGIAVVKGLQLEVDEIVFTGLASALALLSNEQKELGSLVIDMGGGTTEYVVYAEGTGQTYCVVLAVGGDNYSNQICLYGRRFPLSRAEQLKSNTVSAASGRLLQGQVRYFRRPAWDCRPRTSIWSICAASCRCFEEIISVDRVRAGPVGIAGPVAGRGICVRRRRTDAWHTNLGRKYLSIARLSGQDQLHQRAQIGAGPAGICHRHWPRQIRFVADEAQAGRRHYRRNQENICRNL